MKFEFRIGADKQFEVIGVPVGDSKAEEYRRSGPYRLEERQLVSPAINEGLPVQVYPDGNELILVIDDTLWFRLQRR